MYKKLYRKITKIVMLNLFQDEIIRWFNKTAYKQIISTALLVLFLAGITGTSLFAQNASNIPSETIQTPAAASDAEVKMKIETRSSICRNKSPIMIDLLFFNDSNQKQKLCTYRFYDALIKIDLRDIKGKKVEFNPKFVQLPAEKITDKDWIQLPPGRVYKRTFSLTRKIIESTGYKLKSGQYKLKVNYEGCSKFDPSIPSKNLTSNQIYLMVTD